MVYLERVASEIKDIGLYDLILQDIQKILNKTSPTKEEILEVLKSHPKILEDYKQLNVEYNLSNIHLREIKTDGLSRECLELAKEFNKNLKRLKELEPYTLDFEHSSTLVIIFSVEFFVLFSVQYFIVLLNLKKWQWWIYAFFAMSVVVAWIYAKKEKRKFEKNSKEFYKLYEKTLKVLEKLESFGCIKREDLIIKSCDEHI